MGGLLSLKTTSYAQKYYVLPLKRPYQHSHPRFYVSVGRPQRNALLHVLLVCRFFHDTANWLLYESISTVNAYISWPPSVHSRSATYIWPRLKHFDQLHNVLTRSPAISTYVHTLILHGGLYSLVHEWDSIRNILPLLTCLHRLYLIPPTAPIFLEQLLHRPVQLTHLAFLHEWSKPLHEFIRNQPTLEYLAIRNVSYEAVPLVPSLPPIYLPKLRILDCMQRSSNRLDISTPLEHLSIGATDYSLNKGPTPIELLRNLKSLRCPSFMFGDLSRYCERIQFLWLTASDLEDVNDILAIPSGNLQYLSFNPRVHSDAECQALFNSLSNLIIIDHPTIRFVRGSLPYKHVALEEVELENWHELVSDDVAVERCRSLGDIR